MAVPVENSSDGTMCSRLKRPLPLRTQSIRFIPVFIISIVILAAALLVTNARMPDPRIVHPLPDIGFEVIPKIAWMANLTDVCILILNLISVFLVFKLYLLHQLTEGEGEREQMQAPCCLQAVCRLLCRVWDRSGVCNIEKRDVHLIASIRFLTTYIVVLLFRSLVIIMTSYPATDNDCQNPVRINNPLKNIVLTLVTLGSGSIHCGDLMFSGHTIIITLNIMLNWIYGPMVHVIFRPISVAIALFSFYCIIASRSHYTDDILVALYVTATTFLAMGHSPDGAPWQLQLLIRWWPYCSASSRREDLDTQAVVVTCEFTPPHSEAGDGEEELIAERAEEADNTASETKGEKQDLYPQLHKGNGSSSVGGDRPIG